MLGALIFLLVFAAIYEPVRVVIEQFLENGWSELAAAPDTVLLLLALLLFSATVSAITVMLSPQNRRSETRYRVIRRYCAPTSAAPLHTVELPAYRVRTSCHANRWWGFIRRYRGAATVIRLFS